MNHRLGGPMDCAAFSNACRRHGRPGRNAAQPALLKWQVCQHGSDAKRNNPRTSLAASLCLGELLCVDDMCCRTKRLCVSCFACSCFCGSLCHWRAGLRESLRQWTRCLCKNCATIVNSKRSRSRRMRLSLLSALAGRCLCCAPVPRRPRLGDPGVSQAVSPVPCC